MKSHGRSEIISPCETFDTSSMPKLIRDYIHCLREQTGSDIIILLQSLLCSLSAIIGKKRYVSEKSFHQELYPVIWCLTIAVSGSFKSTALNKGSAISYKLDAEIKEEIIKLEADIEQAEAENVDENVKSALQKDLNYQKSLSPFLADDGSMQGLIKELYGKNGGQLLLPEFGAYMKSIHASYNDGYKEKLTRFYDCEKYSGKIATKRDGVEYMPEYPFVTMNAVSTMAWVKKNLAPTDFESGFSARFLLFYPPQKRTKGKAFPSESKQNISDFIDKIYETVKQIQLSEAKEMTFTDEAKARLETILNELENLADREELIVDILYPYVRRWYPAVIKIAMLLEPFINNPESETISLEAVNGAYSIVQYAISSTVYLLQNDLGETEQQMKQRKIYEFIKDRGGEVKRPEIIASRRLDGGSKEYDNVIETLIEQGRISAKNGNGKMNITYCIVNPD